MAKRLALGFLAGASVVILSIFFFAPRAATWLFPVLVMGFPIALVTVAVSRGGRVGRVRGPLLALFAMLQVGSIGVVAFDGAGTDPWFGLPVSLSFLLLFVWLGPLFLTTLMYAATFSDLGIDEALLEHLEERRRSR